MSVDSVSLRFSVAAGGLLLPLLLPLAGAVAGRCCEALLRPNTITAARTADTCDGRRDWEPAGARCVEVAAGAAHSRCARGDAPVGAPVAKQLCLGEV